MKLNWLPLICALITPTAFAFPQCKDGRYTNSTQEVRQMVKEVLGVNGTSVIEDAPYKGTRAQVYLITSGSTFQFRSKSSVDITAPAKVCQKSNKSLVAVLNTSKVQLPGIKNLFKKNSYTLTINAARANQVHISEASGLLNNTFSAQ